jgi:hypothetical protein
MNGHSSYFAHVLGLTIRIIGQLASCSRTQNDVPIFFMTFFAFYGREKTPFDTHPTTNTTSSVDKNIAYREQMNIIILEKKHGILEKPDTRTTCKKFTSL